MPVSRPAVLQHLKVLKDAGACRRTHGEGAPALFAAARLVELRAWLDSFWDDALEAFYDGSGNDTGHEEEQTIRKRLLSHGSASANRQVGRKIAVKMAE
jgi:hypothetical protein